MNSESAAGVADVVVATAENCSVCWTPAQRTGWKLVYPKLVPRRLILAAPLAEPHCPFPSAKTAPHTEVASILKKMRIASFYKNLASYISKAVGPYTFNAISTIYILLIYVNIQK